MFMPRPEAFRSEEIRYGVRDEFHAREIPVRKITGGATPGIFNLTGFGTHCWGPRADFLHRKCEETGRNFVAFTYTDFKLAAKLVNERTVTVMDFAPDRWARDADIVFRDVCEGQQIVIGNSYGGDAALRLAATYPDRVAALVLIAPVTNFGGQMVSPLLRIPQVKEALEKDGFFDYAVQPLPGTGERAMRLTQASINSALQRRSFAQRDVIEVGCPVIVIHDPHDKVIPIESSQELVGRIKGPHRRELISAAGCSHQGKSDDHQVMWDHLMHLCKA